MFLKSITSFLFQHLDSTPSMNDLKAHTYIKSTDFLFPYMAFSRSVHSLDKTRVYAN